jgi:hypothetical protein
MTDFAAESGHWYKPDGSPFYTMIGKNGKKRNVNLRDARKVGAGPAVSTIIRVPAAQNLENWKDDRLLEVADANPRLPDEDIEVYCRRMKAIQRELGSIAPDLGSHIHGCIEKSLIKQYDWDGEYARHVNGAIACLGGWCGLTYLNMEKSFFHHLGFGGKCDVHKPGFVADFKTKDFDGDNLPAVYDNHAQQLAAYREGFKMPHARCAIIYVSTKIPGLTHLVEIDQDELSRGWEMFCTLLRYWKLKNNYYPEPRKEPEHGERERTITSIQHA